MWIQLRQTPWQLHIHSAFTCHTSFHGIFLECSWLSTLCSSPFGNIQISHNRVKQNAVECCFFSWSITVSIDQIFRKWSEIDFDVKKNTDLSFLSLSHHCAGVFWRVCSWWSLNFAVSVWNIGVNSSHDKGPDRRPPPTSTLCSDSPPREGGAESECVYFQHQSRGLPPLWLRGELRLCREAKQPKRRR